MTERQRRIGLGCNILSAMFEYIIAILMSGVFLAKLTTTMGFSDSLTAILTSFVSLGSALQIASIAVFRKNTVKRKVITLHLINQICFLIVYLVPLFECGAQLKTILFILFLLSGHFIANLVSAPKSNWMYSLIHSNIRGTFTAAKEMVSLIGGIVFQIVMGNVIDELEAGGELRKAFVLSALVILVMLIAHAVSLFCIQEEVTESSRIGTSFREKLSGVLQDKVIMKVLVSGVLWSVANQLTVSFLGVYQIKELGFSMAYIAGLSVLYTVVRVPCSFVFGRYADKHSFAAMLKICYLLAVISFGMIVFTTPATGKFLYPLYTIFNAAAVSGINGGEVAIVFDYAPSFKTRDTLAVKQTVCGLLGFLVTVCAAPFVDRIQQSGNRIWGIPLYAQQILALFSMLLGVGIVCYLHKVVSKIKPA